MDLRALPPEDVVIVVAVVAEVSGCYVVVCCLLCVICCALFVVCLLFVCCCLSFAVGPQQHVVAGLLHNIRRVGMGAHGGDSGFRGLCAPRFRYYCY